MKKKGAKIAICSSLLLGTILCTSIITTSCSNANENNGNSNAPTLNFTQGTFDGMLKDMGVTQQTPDKTFYSIDGGKTAIEYGNEANDAKVSELARQISTAEASIKIEILKNPNVELDFTEINKLSKTLQTFGYYKSVNKYFVYYTIFNKQSIFDSQAAIMYAIENV